MKKRNKKTHLGPKQHASHCLGPFWLFPTFQHPPSCISPKAWVWEWWQLLVVEWWQLLLHCGCGCHTLSDVALLMLMLQQSHVIKCDTKRKKNLNLLTHHLIKYFICRDVLYISKSHWDPTFQVAAICLLLLLPSTVSCNKRWLQLGVNYWRRRRSTVSSIISPFIFMAHEQ